VNAVQALDQATRELSWRRMLMPAAAYREVLATRVHELRLQPEKRPGGPRTAVNLEGHHPLPATRNGLGGQMQGPVVDFACNRPCSAPVCGRRTRVDPHAVVGGPAEHAARGSESASAAPHTQIPRLLRQKGASS
jgi:hypothetical protein